MKKTILFSFLLCFVCLSNNFAQTTITLNPSKDNTLYESSIGDVSNGSGTHLYAGKTKQSSNSLRRGLIKFDLSSIPSSAIIDTAYLEMNINLVAIGAGSDTLKLHGVNQGWGEGTSSVLGAGGKGAASTTGDATWIHREFNTLDWSNAGGDYEANPSAFVVKDGTGKITFTDKKLTEKVQSWVKGTTVNEGLIIVGEEGTSGSAKRLNSRENSSNMPALVIKYLTTGLVERPNEKVFEIYPNPATDVLHIEHRKNLFNQMVLITDINGKEVIKSVLDASNICDISTLKTGTYFVQMTSRDNERITKKFIKH